MADYYQIQIGDDIFLTRDGNVQPAGIGSRCALTVEGVPGLQSNYTKNLFRDFRGNPIVQKTEVGKKGRDVVVTVTGKLPAEVAEAIIVLHQTSEAADSVVRLKGDEGDTPDFDLDVLPSVDAFTWAGFDGFRNYLGAVLRYVTVGGLLLLETGDQLIDGGDRLIDTR